MKEQLGTPRDEGQTPETDALFIEEANAGHADFWPALCRMRDHARSLERKLRAAEHALAEEARKSEEMLNSYAEENQRFHDRMEAAESQNKALVATLTLANTDIAVLREERRQAEAERDALREEREALKAAGARGDYE